jgi:hypothetical protein
LVASPCARNPISRCPRNVVDTPATMRGSGAITRERYVRVRVRNKGRRIAKNVRCMIERIVFFPVDADAETNSEEVLDLLWVFVEGTVCDIPANSHRFVDLCHATMVPNSPSLFRLGARYRYGLSHCCARVGSSFTSLWQQRMRQLNPQSSGFVGAAAPRTP